MSPALYFLAGAVFTISAAALSFVVIFVAAERMDVEQSPMFVGWCLDCDRPGFVTAQWKCERCGSGSVINIRPGGDETVRA